MFALTQSASKPPQSSTSKPAKDSTASALEDDWHEVSAQSSEASWVSDDAVSQNEDSNDHPKINTDAKDTLVGDTGCCKWIQPRIMHHMIDGVLHQVTYNRQCHKTDEGGSGTRVVQFQGVDPSWEASSWYLERDLKQIARTGTFGTEEDNNNAYLLKAVKAMTSRGKRAKTISKGKTSLARLKRMC